MRDAAMSVTAFTRDTQLSDYVADKQLRWSVERGFEIIGEALNQLRESDPALAARISEHRSIISFRNVLIHGYSQVNHTTTWNIIQEKLPILIKELHQLLNP